MLHSAASNLGLHCLLTCLSKILGYYSTLFASVLVDRVANVNIFSGLFNSSS